MDLYKESRIEGDFEGFGGDKVYELVDGSRWEQVRYKYRYRYRYRPIVKIWKDGSRFYLDVECMDEKIEVRRA